MECNKDEAIRAKDIAMRKFTEKDFAGAKKFALKAQTLYPGLECISQMLTTLEVYISAESRVNGEMDMYAILGVNPMDDDETLKKQYRKLVLQLHPDKNKFIGADGAFQIVSEAFNFLCDKGKRSAYNIRRNIKTTQPPKVPSQSGVSVGPTSNRQFQPKFPTQGGVSGAPPPTTGKSVGQTGPTRVGVSGVSQQRTSAQSGNSTVPPMVNGYHKHPSSSTTSRGKSHKGSTQKTSTPAQMVFKKENATFWTVCTRCKMQYEYMRVYINQILQCPHCKLGFVAVEIPPPSNLSSIPPQQTHRESSSSRSGSHITGFNSSNDGTSARWSPVFGTTSYNNSTASMDPRRMGKLMNERIKREREEMMSNGSSFVTVGEGPPQKKREMGDNSRVSSQSGIGNKETENSEAGKPNFSRGIDPRFYGNRELSQVELRKLLTGKAVVEIRKKLSEWKFSGEAKIATKDKEKAKFAKNISTDDNTQQEAVEMVTMSVPDPDFHVFDLDRSESCFGENQVWAAYDNTDGMPRFYAMIHEVISMNPFKVKISWLNSKTNTEFGSLNWVDRGFLKTCGDFRIGKHETNKSLNSFSHKVKWVKGPRGVIQIYPRKGDIWALYRNWSSDWNSDTPDEVVHVYDMVEVLDDYNEEKGVSVSPLFKAAGFRTVFYKKPDPKEVKLIPKEEMFRFSHQVPSHILTGQEKPAAPKGYIELDPAATPLELLQVTAP